VFFFSFFDERIVALNLALCSLAHIFLNIATNHTPSSVAHIDFVFIEKLFEITAECHF
jgi:hypothetical protein